MKKVKLLNESLAVHESAQSDKIIYFISSEELYERLGNVASGIINAANNGQLWGLYLNENDEIEAQII